LVGDAIPAAPELIPELPLGKCLLARETYGKLLREGPKRELADALVAVTEFDGWVPAKTPAHLVVSDECSFETRTIAYTYGQLLQVKNKGPEAVIPQLIGVSSGVLLVALPGGPPVDLLAPKPGQYRLVDQTHPFATADVFVLAYPTTDVTDTLGRFEITGIPAGTVKLSVMIPAFRQTHSQQVTIDPAKTAEVEIEMPINGAELAAALVKLRKETAPPVNHVAPSAP
jgi:hypothetical protein